MLLFKPNKLPFTLFARLEDRKPALIFNLNNIPDRNNSGNKNKLQLSEKINWSEWFRYG